MAMRAQREKLNSLSAQWEVGNITAVRNLL
jgi:hypothetical protein